MWKSTDRPNGTTSCRWSVRIDCPLLFTYGQLELDSGSVAFAGVPAALRESARTGQTLEIVVIAGADHNYSRCAAPLAEVLQRWLQA